GDFARIGRYRRARQEVEARRQALGRGGRRGERNVAEAETGRLALVRRKGGPGLALILGTHSIRGRRVLIDALLPHGAVVRVKSGVVKRIFWATPPLHVPRDLDRASEGRGRDGRGLRHLAAELGRLSVAELVERERAQGPEAALSAIECHRCPWGAQPRCDREWRELEALTERLGLRKRPRLRRKLDQLTSLTNTIYEAQRARHLRMPLAVHAGFMPAVYRWADGEDDWGAIVEESFGGHEGDLIRAMRRLIDLLRQL